MEEKLYKVTEYFAEHGSTIINRPTDFMKAVDIARRINEYRIGSFAVFGKMSYIDKQLYVENDARLRKMLRSDYKWILDLIQSDLPDFQTKFPEDLTVSHLHTLTAVIDYPRIRLIVGVRQLKNDPQDTEVRVISSSFVEITFCLPKLDTAYIEIQGSITMDLYPEVTTMAEIKQFMTQSW